MDVAAALKKLDFIEVIGAGVELAEVSLSFSEERGKLSWRALPDGALADFAFHGTLPNDDDSKTDTLTLRPQKGVVAAVESLHEIHVEDAAVDAAWIIHGTAPALLLALVKELRALAPFAPSVDVNTALEVTLARVDDEAAVAALLALWHRAVFFRMGVS